MREIIIKQVEARELQAKIKGEEMQNIKNESVGSVAMVLNKDGLISSLAICQEINRLRIKEGNRAELKHYTLLEIIRDEFSDEFEANGKAPINRGSNTAQNILVSEYKDKSGKKNLFYMLSPNYAKQILLRESKFVRKNIIRLLDELEEQLRNGYKLPKNFKEALEMLIEGEKEKEKLSLENQKTLIELDKANQRVELLVHQGVVYTSTQLAKEVGMSSAHKLNKLLHREGVQFFQSNTWLLYAKYSEEDYVSIKQQELDNGVIIYNRVWTGKGRDFVINFLLKRGLIVQVTLKDGKKRFKYIGD